MAELSAGYCLASWNGVQAVFAYNQGWTLGGPDNTVVNDSYNLWYPIVLTTATNLGAMVAAFCAGYLVR